jgi:hypothetical protein
MKRKKTTTPTQRSLKKLRDEGWICEKVERPWNPHTKRTQDLFGFGDILAFKGSVTIIVQTTGGDGGNFAARRTKILASPIAKAWADFGVPFGQRSIVLHGWRKAGAKGQRKLWQCRQEGLFLPDGCKLPE